MIHKPYGNSYHSCTEIPIFMIYSAPLMAQVPSLDVMMNGPYITQTAPIRENLCESCGSLWSFPLSASSARQAPVNKAAPSSFPWT